MRSNSPNAKQRRNAYASSRAAQSCLARFGLDEREREPLRDRLALRLRFVPCPAAPESFSFDLPLPLPLPLSSSLSLSEEELSLLLELLESSFFFFACCLSAALSACLSPAPSFAFDFERDFEREERRLFLSAESERLAPPFERCGLAERSRVSFALALSLPRDRELHSQHKLGNFEQRMQ